MAVTAFIPIIVNISHPWVKGEGGGVMAICIATCTKCGNQQEIIVPVKSTPICRVCKKEMWQ